MIMYWWSVVILSLFVVDFVVCCPFESSGVSSALRVSTDLVWAWCWFDSILVQQHVGRVEGSNGGVVSSCWFVVALFSAISILLCIFLKRIDGVDSDLGGCVLFFWRRVAGCRSCRTGRSVSVAFGFVFSCGCLRVLFWLMRARF